MADGCWLLAASIDIRPLMEQPISIQIAPACAARAVSQSGKRPAHRDRRGGDDAAPGERLPIGGTTGRLIARLDKAQLLQIRIDLYGPAHAPHCCSQASFACCSGINSECSFDSKNDVY
jgi:hypothetical protein